MNTALAPNANALSTSVPCLTPPSRYTSTLPLTASATSPNASIYNLLVTFLRQSTYV